MNEFYKLTIYSIPLDFFKDTQQNKTVEFFIQIDHHNIIDNVFHLKTDDFYNFINGLVGQQLVDILHFQSINSTQCLIRSPVVFEIFNMNCSEPDFLTIRGKLCFQLDNGKYIAKVELLNNLNCLLDFLKQQQSLIVKNDSTEKYPGLSYEFIDKHPLLKTLID